MASVALWEWEYFVLGWGFIGQRQAAHVHLCLTTCCLSQSMLDAESKASRRKILRWLRIEWGTWKFTLLGKWEYLEGEKKEGLDLLWGKGPVVHTLPTGWAQWRNNRMWRLFLSVESDSKGCAWGKQHATCAVLLLTVIVGKGFVLCRLLHCEDGKASAADT